MGHSKQVTKLMILLTLFIVRSIDMTHMLIVYLLFLIKIKEQISKDTQT